MLSDTEIAARAETVPIQEIASRLGIQKEDLIPYGDQIAKVNINAQSRPRPKSEPGKLILVSATTPTKAGEGKTTTSIGLGQAFSRLGESVCVALREPSLGPCLGVKGGLGGLVTDSSAGGNRVCCLFSAGHIGPELPITLATRLSSV